MHATLPSTSPPKASASASLTVKPSAGSHRLSRAELPAFSEVVDGPGRILLDYLPERCVKLLPNGMVVKWGAKEFIREDEALAMELAGTVIAEVPLCYGYFVEDQTAFLFMSYIEGKDLESQWTVLSAEERAFVLRSIAEGTGRLHSISAPPASCLGNLSQTAAPFLFLPHLPCPPPTFVDEGDALDFLKKEHKKCFPDHPLHLHYDGSTASTSLRFIHGDLAPRNILVHNGRLAGILDWERAGWYPAHYETMRATVERKARRSAAADAILQLLPSFPDEMIADYLVLFREFRLM